MNRIIKTLVIAGLLFAQGLEAAAQPLRRSPRFAAAQAAVHAPIAERRVGPKARQAPCSLEQEIVANGKKKSGERTQHQNKRRSENDAALNTAHAIEQQPKTYNTLAIAKSELTKACNKMPVDVKKIELQLTALFNTLKALAVDNLIQLNNCFNDYVVGKAFAKLKDADVTNDQFKAYVNQFNTATNMHFEYLTAEELAARNLVTQQPAGSDAATQAVSMTSDAGTSTEAVSVGATETKQPSFWAQAMPYAGVAAGATTAVALPLVVPMLGGGALVVTTALSAISAITHLTGALNAKTFAQGFGHGAGLVSATAATFSGVSALTSVDPIKVLEDQIAQLRTAHARDAEVIKRAGEEIYRLHDAARAEIARLTQENEMLKAQIATTHTELSKCALHHTANIGWGEWVQTGFKFIPFMGPVTAPAPVIK